MSYQKIRSLYNNRKSRESIITKQCNFSLSTSADKNIKKLASVNRLTRSDIVDIFFRDLKKLERFYGGKLIPEDLINPDHDFTSSSSQIISPSVEPTP